MTDIPPQNPTSHDAAPPAATETRKRMLTSRTDACLSDFALDRVVADASAARPAHLAACALCAARLATFIERQESDGVRALALARRAMADEGARRRTWRFDRWPVLLAGAASAAIALFVALPETTEIRAAEVMSPSSTVVTEDRVRSKGIGLRVHVRRDGDVREASSNDLFREGDALRLDVTAPGKSHVMVVGVTESGALTVYHPFGGEHAAPMSGARELLPGSLVLDGSETAETLLVVAGQAPFAKADLESAISREKLRSAVIDAAALRTLDVPGEKAVFVIRRN